MTEPRKQACRILVVDDEPLVCDSIRRILAHDEYEVETSTSGHQALTLFQPGKFSLVIVDYDMPEMKGDRLAAAIKALDPKQPIMMITGYPEPLRYAGDFPLAVDKVITKPFDFQEFREAVSKWAAQA